MALTKILPGALGAGAVDSTAAVATGAIQADDLQSGTVTANKLGAGAVVSGVINTACAIDFDDNIKTRWGTSQDLEIYHDGSNSYIQEDGAGQLILRSWAPEIQAGYSPSSSRSTGDIAFKALPDGAAELYYDAVKKLNTESYGVVVQEDLKIIGAEGGDAKLRLVGDEGDDNADNWRLRVSSNYFYIENYADGAWEKNYSADPSAGVSLYYNNVAQCYTNSVGLKFNDDKQVRWGTDDDMRIYHDNTQAIINNATGTLKVRSNNLQLTRADNEVHVNCVSGAQVELNHSGNKKFETTAAGGSVSGDLGVGITTPTTAYDKSIQVYASNVGAVIKLTDSVSGSASTDGFDIISHDANAYIFQRENAPIYFATNATVRALIDDAGHLRPNANNTYDCGSNSYRWRNLYTNDLNLSNEGSANEVDGTWGNYTIQEGEDDLFLINKRNGKKYKFNLTEVS